MSTPEQTPPAGDETEDTATATEVESDLRTDDEGRPVDNPAG